MAVSCLFCIFTQALLLLTSAFFDDIDAVGAAKVAEVLFSPTLLPPERNSSVLVERIHRRRPRWLKGHQALPLPLFRLPVA